MAAKHKRGNAVAVGDLATEILDPVLRRRAGMSIALVQCWDEIVGERLAAMSRPEKIAWPKRVHEDDPFEPATLIVACEGVAAMRIQHETGEVVARVNAFLGFAAIGRIRIVQKQVVKPGARAKPRPRELSDAESARLGRLVEGIEDEGLRASLERLGRAVMSARR
jgi:hypothetical protein